MKLQAFQTFAEQKGFLPSGKMAFGIVEQYPVSLEYTNGNGKRSVMILQFMLKAPLDKAQQKELRGQLAKAAALYVNQGTIRFQITAKDSDVDDQFESVKNTALAFFKQNGLTPISQCPICHGENCDTAAFYAGGYRAVHSQCLHTAMEQVSDAAARNQQNGSYLLGLIGGLLGGIVGIIPSVLTILFMERIYSILYALIPLCIYWGYKLLKGKLNKAAIAMTIVLSIVFLFVLEYVVLVFGVYQEYDIFSPAQCFQLFIEPEIFAEIIKGMGTSFLFLILGILISWGQITKTPQTTVMNMQSVLQTSQSLTPAAGQPGWNPFDSANSDVSAVKDDPNPPVEG